MRIVRVNSGMISLFTEADRQACQLPNKNEAWAQAVVDLVDYWQQCQISEIDPEFKTLDRLITTIGG